MSKLQIKSLKALSLGALCSLHVIWSDIKGREGAPSEQCAELLSPRRPSVSLRTATLSCPRRCVLCLKQYREAQKCSKVQWKRPDVGQKCTF
uniref:Secreted protein n=1 Tax=Sparus aurata TaxID=8175 RepID=A0A671WVL1_SPAAU